VDRMFVERIVGRISPFLETFLGSKGLFIVDIIIRGQKGNLVLEVFIDGDTGVNTAACAETSRALSKELDERVLQGENYALTVSSPGLDRPLKFPRQYAKHAGREIMLEVRADGGPVRITGILAEARADAVGIRMKGSEALTEVPFSDILEARIKPRW